MEQADMSTKIGNVVRFWRGVPETSEVRELTYDPSDLTELPPNMEQLAKNIELARAHKLDCDAEAMKADGLLQRCIDAYEEEEKRRGLKSRK